MEATTRVRAVPSMAAADISMTSGHASADITGANSNPIPTNGASGAHAKPQAGRGPALNRPGLAPKPAGLARGGLGGLGSRLRAIRKRDARDEMEPPSFSLGIGEASQMPSFDLGIDFDEPSGGAKVSRGLGEGLQRLGAVRERDFGTSSASRKAAGGDPEGGFNEKVQLERRGTRKEASEGLAEQERREPVVAEKRQTADGVNPEAAAKTRTRLRKLSSDIPERNTLGSETTLLDPLQKATPAVVSRQNGLAGIAFADSDEEDAALLSIDFRSAGKHGLTPVRGGLESGQGLGLGGWRKGSGVNGATERASAYEVGANRNEPIHTTPRAVEARGMANGGKQKPGARISESGQRSSDTGAAPEVGARHADAGRCQGDTEGGDQLRTPLAAETVKQAGIQKIAQSEPKGAEPSRRSEGFGGLRKGTSQPGRSSLRGIAFVPDSEDDEEEDDIEDPSSPEAKNGAGAAARGKKRVPVGLAHQPSKRVSPCGALAPSPSALEKNAAVPGSGALKRTPVLKLSKGFGAGGPGLESRLGGDGLLGGEGLKKRLGEGTGRQAFGQESSEVFETRKRKSDENGGAWSEWPGNDPDELARGGVRRKSHEKENGYGNRFGMGERGAEQEEKRTSSLKERDCGLADNPGTNNRSREPLQDTSPSWVARETKTGKGWPGSGATEGGGSGFGGFGSASFGAVEGGAPGFGGFGSASERTYPKFGAADGLFGTASERTYPSFGAKLGDENPGFGEGFEETEGDVAGGSNEDDAAKGGGNLRRSWTPPWPDFGSQDEAERMWRGGAKKGDLGKGLEREWGEPEAREEWGPEWDNGTEPGADGTAWVDGTERATGGEAGGGGTGWGQTEGIPGWMPGEREGTDGARLNGMRQDGTREGGTRADGMEGNGIGGPEQEAVVRLLRERLPHYKPLDMLMREGGFDNEPIFIDYRNQFAEIPSGGGGSSRNFGGKKASGGRRPAKPSERVPTDGAKEKGHWTTVAGKKVYVNKTGKTLEGQAAYRSHLKDSGATPKKRRKKARRKGGGKKK